MKVMMRVEGGPSIDMRHVIRCLTLGHQLVRSGAQAEYIGTAFTCRAITRYWPGVRCHVLPGGLSQWQDAQRCRVLALRGRCDWLVVDCYRLGARWEQLLRGVGVKILAIDDVGRAHRCDILTDSKPGAASRYRFRGRRLFGPAYALLREAFLQARKSALMPKTPRLFICFGGSDPADMTAFSAKALAGVLPGGTQVDVVVGLGYRNVALLEHACREQGWQLHVGHPAPERLMARATLALGAGGTMNAERCMLGLPAVVVTIADNQHPHTLALHRAGALLWLGDAGQVSAGDLRKAVLARLDGDAMMAARARAQLDGNGARRVVRSMKDYV